MTMRTWRFYDPIGEKPIRQEFGMPAKTTKSKTALSVVRYDQSVAIRPQNTIPARPKPEKPDDANCVSKYDSN
jgi:hypothetical protein